MTKTRELVRKIHENGPHGVVLAITGGGAEAVGELLRYGGGSNTLLEAVIPYDQKSFDDFVKGKPDKYCSAGAARDLAMAAFMRAVKLKGDHSGVGVGVSCSLAKGGSERAERQHLVYVAFQTQDLTGTYEYEIDRDSMYAGTGHGPEARELEEKFASDKILNAVVAGLALEGRTGFLEDSLPVKRVESSVVLGLPGHKELVRGQADVTTHANGGRGKYMLCGAFNPVHERHLEIARKVHEAYGQRVDFELCIQNVDKPPLNYYDMRQRLETLQAELNGQSWAGDIHFTRLGTFVRKSLHFPGTTFVVGMDTFLRIGDEKYYADHEDMFRSFERVEQCGCRFLVFNRVVAGRTTTQADAEGMPRRLRRLAEFVPDDLLPPSDMCSSNLRKGG